MPGIRKALEITVSRAASFNPCAGANSRDTILEVLAANGTTLIERDDDDGTGNGGDGITESALGSAIGGRTLTAGGTFFIRVVEFGNSFRIDPYRLFVVLTTQ